LLAALGSVGTLLYFLLPQLSAAPSGALEQSQAFTVPFSVTNPGPLPIKHVAINCYVRHLQAVGYTMSGEFGDLWGDPSWRFSELDRGEAKTVVCPFLRTPGPLRSADLSVVVEYESYVVPFYRYRTIFRFVGQHGDDWHWLPQPSYDIRTEIDKALKQFRPEQFSK